MNINLENKWLWGIATSPILIGSVVLSTIYLKDIWRFLTLIIVLIICNWFYKVAVIEKTKKGKELINLIIFVGAQVVLIGLTMFLLKK